jgi:hypothetical protein
MRGSQNKYVPSEADRNTVRTMAAGGFPHESIARCLGERGIDKKTLYKYFRDDLDTALDKATAAVVFWPPRMTFLYGGSNRRAVRREPLHAVRATGPASAEAVAGHAVRVWEVEDGPRQSRLSHRSGAALLQRAVRAGASGGGRALDGGHRGSPPPRGAGILTETAAPSWHPAPSRCGRPMRGR